jgi:hypothetical protein
MSGRLKADRKLDLEAGVENYAGVLCLKKSARN